MYREKKRTAHEKRTTVEGAEEAERTEFFSFAEDFEREEREKEGAANEEEEEEEEEEEDDVGRTESLFTRLYFLKTLMAFSFRGDSPSMKKRGEREGWCMQLRWKKGPRVAV